MVFYSTHDRTYDDYCEARAEEKNEARQIEEYFEEMNKQSTQKTQPSSDEE